MVSESKNKKDLLLYLLKKGDTMVCLDARRGNVDVPMHHKGNSSLSLILNLNFRRPLDIFDDGIYATLSFQGRPHKCVIPFEAIWAIFIPSFQEGQVWETCIPNDVQFDPKFSSAGKDQKSTQTLKAVPALKEKKGEKIIKISGKATEENKTIKPASAKRDRGHLRIIK